MRVSVVLRSSFLPIFIQIFSMSTIFSKFWSNNVMDNMIKMMERYSNHLEEIVQERTVEIEDEKNRSEQLLYRMLPQLYLFTCIVSQLEPKELFAIWS